MSHPVSPPLSPNPHESSKAHTLESAQSDRPIVVWFRDDLRLADNPALDFAAKSGRPVLPIFIRDVETDGLRRNGGAADWWLAGSLEALDSSLRQRGSALHIMVGRAESVIADLVAATQAAGVVWNRRYGAAEQAQDAGIKAALKAAGVHAQSFNSHLIREPWEVRSKTGTPMKVFTPFWRAARELGEPSIPASAPAAITAGIWPSGLQASRSVASLNLRPTSPDWAKEMATLWTPGEAGARQNLARFLEAAATGYGENRNRPDKRSTSRLSPHLRFGEIGPRQIWHATRAAFESGHTPAKAYDIDKFLAEIGWREFSYHLLHQQPELARRNFQPRFDAFPWSDDQGTLKAWQRGMTGYPIVDAGMRELWRTGWMHNRVRMIVGSFLVKHLLIDWRKGEDWFWDTLVDADPASNAASWQWVAGSGADAAPYFRIFAPVLQGEKFDPEGTYVRTYVPELAQMPKAFIHKPWAAPHPVLAKAGITLGRSYPHPIVIHERARERALAAFKTLSGAASDADAME
jgi:deoxyribodipyrimidine photo-lyase